MSEQSKRIGLGKWLLFGLLIVVVFILESVAIHSIYTAKHPGTSDFYSRWAGARALLLEGRDPYSVKVTAEIQQVIGVDPSFVGKGGFAYPLFTIFAFWPLVYLTYDWVQAIWMVALQWIAMATVLVLLRLKQWQPSPIGLVGLFLATLLLYPVTRTVFLGQFTLHVTLFLAIALWALESHHDAWAGVCLAMTSIKPQLVLFLVPWLMLWAIGQRRWRVLVGLLAGGGMLMLASLALFPRWPLSFLEDMLRYSKVAGGRSPLVVLMDLLWPGGPEAVRYAVAALLILAMLVTWWRNWRQTGRLFYQALYWTIVVSLLVPFQTGTTSQVLLLIPMLAWLHIALEKWGRGWSSAVTIGAEIALWALFLSTIQGDWENPVMFLPLPLLSLAVLVGIEIKWRWSNRQLADPTTIDRPR